MHIQASVMVIFLLRPMWLAVPQYYYIIICIIIGPHTQIVEPNRRVRLNLSGNSGLGTAGTGDVLCGVIAAMFTLSAVGENRFGDAVASASL